MDELLARLKVRLEIDSTDEDSLLEELIQSAVDTVNNLRNYTSTDSAIVESVYKSLVVDMAIVSYNRLGAEGETSHNENGVSRTFATGDYPAYLLNRIMVVPR